MEQIKTLEELKQERKEYQKAYREANKERLKEKQKVWREANKEKTKENQKVWRETNKEHVKEYYKNYRKENKDKRKVWDETNKEERKEYQKLYRENNKEDRYNKILNKSKNDNIYNLILRIRVMITNTFRYKGVRKNSKTERVLGCSIEEFKKYLESKFEPWMNWDNRGNWNGYPTEINTAWDVDHIIPLSTAKTEEDVIRLSHYTNLRPLCSYTNRHKKR